MKSVSAVEIHWRLAISFFLIGMAQPCAAELPAAKPPNLIRNGDAEVVDEQGSLVGWSIYLREGEAKLSQTTRDQVTGKAAVRLELLPGVTNFDLKIAHVVVSASPKDTTYLLTGQVKSEAKKKDRLAGYFCLGTSGDLKIGKFQHNAGWQEIQLKITIPAGKAISRLELSGGSRGPAVILIDNVRLEILEGAKPVPATDPASDSNVPGPPQPAISLKAGVPILVKKILPTDCRLVRGITHAPIDGREDTRYSTGVVSEWNGLHGAAAVNYRVFNGNNGLHITLAEEGFDKLLMRGTWRGKLYANYEGLKRPDDEHPALCSIHPRSGVVRKSFKTPVHSRRLSFFYKEGQRGTLNNVSFLKTISGTEFFGADVNVTYHLSKPTVPGDILSQEITSRFGPKPRIHRLGDSTGKKASLGKNEALHLLTPEQDVSQGLTAVSLQLDVEQIEPNSVLTVQLQDVVDPRREAMGVDFQVPGPGKYTLALDFPDQIFLPPKASWKNAPRLDGPIAPPPVVWMTISSDSSVRLQNVAVTLHQIDRKKALYEAGTWRKFLLRGLFAAMSEPRPWMHLQDKLPVREQIYSSAAIERYKTSLVELLENAEIARLLLPEDDVVRQYHQWLYQNIDRRKPQPPPTLAEVPGAPRWAVLVRESWNEMNAIARWWLDHRLTPNGELGGGIQDDTDLFQVWQCLPMIESEPLGRRLKDVGAQQSELALKWKLEEGLNKRSMDALHAYEEGVNQLALCAWWFYGDPVHFERVMTSARSTMKLLVETDDGRVHFGGNDFGIEEARHGFDSIGKSPGAFGWAPARLMFHPMYVVAAYNRNPAVLEKYQRWGQTWADFQKPGAFVDKVDIKTGKPIKVSQLPPSAAIGPVDEWLALYQLTDDPKWHAPFKMGIDGGGFSGVTPQYGRSAHALVRWQGKYRERMGKIFSSPQSGYAGFFIHKDRTLLESWLADSASWFGRFPYMHTAAEPKTDRVLTYKATTPLSCYLGDAPNRNRWLNFTAVSYENLRGEDFAALVWDAGPKRLRVAIYNFNDKPLRGQMRTWRLDHGRYQVSWGPDKNDDGELDAPVETKAMELQRYASIPLNLPPRQVTMIEVEQTKRLDDLLERADLALSSLDTRLKAGGKLDVQVHNIGAKSAREIRVELVRGKQVIASQIIPQLDAPLDLKPRIATVRFEAIQPGDVVLLDPKDTIAEIAEHNNRLTVQAAE